MTRDPDAQVRDYPVLKAILAHRTPMAGGEPPLGVTTMGMQMKLLIALPAPAA